MNQITFSELRSREEGFVLYLEALYSIEPSLFHSISLSARALQCTLAYVLDNSAGCCGCEPNLRSIKNNSGKR